MEIRSIKEFHSGLLEKKFSAAEATKHFFDVIEKKNKDLNAYLSIQKNAALLQASKVDVMVAEGKNLSMMAGVPLGIKDNILIEGAPMTAGSKILKDYVASYDATVIEKLKGEHAVFLGKTNMDEFAMGSSTENSAYGVVKNPHDMTRVPGGSSGGSAAVVAADMALASLGSDTGGSIRQPASFCGVVGLKPTYGAVSRYGVTALASSLDQIGPFTKTVEDAAILFKAIAGLDLHDATTFDPKYKDDLINPDLKKYKGMTVGIPEEYFSGGMDAEVGREIEEVISDLKTAGVKFKEISLPHSKYALSVYYIVLPAEVSTNLARFDGIRYGTRGSAKKLLDTYLENKSAGYGAETKRRMILGTFVLSAGYYDAYYGKAQKVRRLISEDFDKAFKEVDVIIAPTAPSVAFKIGEKAADPLQMYLSDIFTIPVNLAGLPGISVPVKGREGKLPIGVQFIGKKWHEADILGMGRLYESL